MLTRLQLERHAPLIVGTVVAAGWWHLEAQISAHYVKELLAALLSAAAIAAGFLTTALSILLPLSSTATGRALKRGGYLPDLYRYLRAALYSCLALAVVCIFAFFSLRESTALESWVATSLVFFSAYAGTALARIAEVLMNLFERASEPEDKQG